LDVTVTLLLKLLYTHSIFKIKYRKQRFVSKNLWKLTLLSLSNISCTILTQLFHNSNNIFLKSTIEYLGPTCRKTNPMVDHKKKVIRVVQKLCKSCARNITHYLLRIWCCVFVWVGEWVCACIFPGWPATCFGTIGGPLLKGGFFRNLGHM